MVSYTSLSGRRRRLRSRLEEELTVVLVLGEEALVEAVQSAAPEVLLRLRHAFLSALALSALALLLCVARMVSTAVFEDDLVHDSGEGGGSARKPEILAGLAVPRAEAAFVLRGLASVGLFFALFEAFPQGTTPIEHTVAPLRHLGRRICDLGPLGCARPLSAVPTPLLGGRSSLEELRLQLTHQHQVLIWHEAPLLLRRQEFRLLWILVSEVRFVRLLVLGVLPLQFRMD